MKRSLHQRWSNIAVNVALAALVVAPVYAATTVGSNTSTDGNIIINVGSGKLGVGTTTPSNLFSVHGNAIISGNVTSVANITATGTLAVTGATTLSSTLGVTGATTHSATSTHTYISNGLGLVGAPSYTFTGDLTNGIWSSGASTLNFSTAGAERARISSVGLFGIGSTTPIQLLSVHGNVLISGNITSVANITATGTLAVTGATTLSSTLGVTGASTFTGLASFGQASSTRFSVFDTAYFGGTATSTFTSAGVLSLQNGETISNATDGTVAITAATTSLSGLGILTNGYLSQASSTVVGNLTVTGTFSPTQTTATTFQVGGGYGDTGATIAATGNIDTNGVLSLTGGIINLGTGSATSTFTSASGLLGIGSTTPSQLFSVHGNSYVSGTSYFGGAITATSTLTLSATSTHTGIVNGLGLVGAPSYTFTGDLNNGIWSSGADTINFSTAGAERARVDSGGNFGIGTTTPGTPLSVTGAAVITGRITTPSIDATSTTATTTLSTGGLTVGTNQFLVQQNSGNVGIGITNPNTKFEVVGTASTTNLIVGGNGTSLAGVVAGYCTFPTITVTASTTNTALCASATGVLSGDRIFAQATSSLPENFIIQAASSTASAVIQLKILNTGMITGTATGINSINFWAFR